MKLLYKFFSVFILLLLVLFPFGFGHLSIIYWLIATCLGLHFFDGFRSLDVVSIEAQLGRDIGEYLFKCSTVLGVGIIGCALNLFAFFTSQILCILRILIALLIL